MPIALLAGSRTTPGFDDGIGRDASFRRIRGMDWKPATDPYVWICDLGNRALRRLNWQTAEVETIYTWSSPETPFACSVAPSGDYVFVSVFDDTYNIGPDANTPLAEASTLHSGYRYDIAGDSMDYLCPIIQCHYLDAISDTRCAGIRWASDSRVGSFADLPGWTWVNWDDDPSDEDDELVWGGFDDHGLILADFQGLYWVRDTFNATYGSRIKAWPTIVFESEDATIYNGLWAGGGAPDDWQREYDEAGAETGNVWWMMNPSGANTCPPAALVDHTSSLAVVEEYGPVGTSAAFANHRAMAVPYGSRPLIAVSGSADTGAHFVGFPAYRGWSVGGVGVG